jgi:hypothetical protein
MKEQTELQFVVKRYKLNCKENKAKYMSAINNVGFGAIQ